MLVEPVRVCPFADCERHIPGRQFCCPSHWRRMSGAERIRVQVAQAALEEGRITSGEFLGIEADVVRWSHQSGGVD